VWIGERQTKAAVTGLEEEMFTQRIFINEGNNMLLMRTKESLRPSVRCDLTAQYLRILSITEYTEHTEPVA